MNCKRSLLLQLEEIKIEEELAKVSDEEDEYKSKNKIEFWEPWPHQQKLLDFIHQNKKLIVDQGANRTGKTVLGVCIVCSACLGYQPWDNQETVWGHKPIRCRILCVDWEHHAKEVIVPVIEEWFPEGSYEVKKNNLGIDAFWFFPKTGSTIELLTHSQKRKSHEGWKGHLIWADEPPPKDKYIANKRGLIDYEGVFLMTMTAVYESWILDDIVRKADNSMGILTNIPMRANPLLSEKAITEFERDCDEDEVIPRVYGGWLQLTGLVYKKFDRNIHVVDNFKIPPSWPVLASIDFHLVTNQAIGFYAWDEYNREFVIDEIWQQLSPEEIADEIIRKKKENSWQLKEVIIDPLSKGDVTNLKQRGIQIEDAFSIIERRLRPYRIRLSIANKDKKSGITNVKTALVGLNKMPTLYFFKNCDHEKKNYGHVWEIQRWIIDRKTNQPVDKDDHFMENLYRSTLAGITYKNPDMYDKPIDLGDEGIV